ncbi:MAG: AbrB/MazE/SpoVT family DNA-binding domain-containing protein [Nocardioidaceae bacterium]|nr:AbrB/MazE/SpoVT family DNA-binding domain-containing protein [Nocardioidaceae bacterium]
MGDRGRVVIPVELRARMGVEPGDPLLLIEAPGGVVLATRDQVKRRVRLGLQGDDLVDELMAERRSAAAVEDVA